MSAQVRARGVGRCAEHQPVIGALRADQKMDLIFFRLQDAVYPPVFECLIQLARQKAEHDAVDVYKRQVQGLLLAPVAALWG